MNIFKRFGQKKKEKEYKRKVSDAINGIKEHADTTYIDYLCANIGQAIAGNEIIENDDWGSNHELNSKVGVCMFIKYETCTHYILSLDDEKANTSASMFLHRFNGPAIEYDDKTIANKPLNEYWLWGEKMTREGYYITMLDTNLCTKSDAFLGML